MLKRIRFLTEGFNHFSSSMSSYLAGMAAQLFMYIVLFFLLHAFLSPEYSVLTVAACLLGLLILTAAYFIFNKKFCTDSLLTAYTMAARLRLRLCDHLRGLPLSFFKSHDTGELASAMTEDMKNVETIYGAYLYDVVVFIVFPCLFSLILFIFDWKLTAILLCSALFAMPLVFCAAGVASRRSGDFLEARDKAFSTLMEYVGGIRELKAANLIGKDYVPLQKHWKDYQKKSIQLEGMYGLLALAYSSALDVGFLLTLAAGLYFLETGALQLSIFIFFLIAGCRFYEPMRELGMTIPELRSAYASFSKIGDILEVAPLPVIPGDKPQGTAIEFKNISFSYGTKKAIENVSFSIPEGGMVALVAPSGSGKSTLANLLLRFWDVDAGKILIGGADIRSLTQEELYGLFSVVFQEVYLFDDTILNNIRIAKPEATQQEVEEAARKACCHDFIQSLDNAYETFVGEGGARLSGGEKQRISIARAILKNAPIVILDEATASLDPENELILQQGLNNLLEGKTLLVIAHRLKTIQYAENIIVLDNGRIIEEGTHDELLAKNGRYTKLWSSQQQLKSW